MAGFRVLVLPLDAVHYLHRTAATPILFQFSADDPGVPQAAALAFFELAGEPKRIEWPDSWESAQESRRHWLGKLLGFD